MKAMKKMNDGVLMRNLLGKMRKLNEVDITREKSNHTETTFDQNREEDKFKAFLKNNSINAIPSSFEKLEVIPNEYVFWGGTIDNVIQFVFIVTNDENTSKVEFNYADTINKDNEENVDLVKKIQDYYDIFYKYWANNNFN